jgi:hypothetical protein
MHYYDLSNFHLQAEWWYYHTFPQVLQWFAIGILGLIAFWMARYIVKNF